MAADKLLVPNAMATPTKSKATRRGQPSVTL
jgi:hypothetical protein